jgi:hypothetical protein
MALPPVTRLWEGAIVCLVLLTAATANHALAYWFHRRFFDVLALCSSGMVRLSQLRGAQDDVSVSLTERGFIDASLLQ